MSPPTLYRKIKGLSDLTPNELINLSRKKAIELLAQGNYSGVVAISNRLNTALHNSVIARLKIPVKGIPPSILCLIRILLMKVSYTVAAMPFVKSISKTGE